jgi:phosphoglycolate phosphatase-like HAD superfamily hydrolase
MHLCFFDIDGTLLLSGGAGQAAMEDALEHEFGITAPTEGISYAGRTDRAIVHEMARFHGIDMDEPTLLRFVEAYLSHLPERLAACRGAVLPGIVELLAALAARDDVTLALLTGNFERGARLKLEHYKLHEHFRFGGFGDVHHERDDVARAALEAGKTHLNGNVTLEKTWVIGDTPADVQCGRAIGAHVVTVATGVFDADELAASQPDHLFEDFSSHSELLDLLFGE